MEKLSKRPSLLAGAIFNIVCFILLAITSSINLFNTFIDWDSTTTADASTIFSAFVNIFLILASLVGVVLSVICMLRANLPTDKFHSKRFLILSTFILNIVIIIFAIVCIQILFNLLTLFVVLALICSSVFIFLDYYKNKVSYYKAKMEKDKEKQKIEEN